VDHEYGVLREIQEMVISGFVDGVPPHRLPSARLPEYDENASSIFVTEWNDFKELSAAEVQAIFRNRHILIRNSGVDTISFNTDGLETLGSISRVVCLQGKSGIINLGSC
jgi:hypothetical protein